MWDLGFLINETPIMPSRRLICTVEVQVLCAQRNSWPDGLHNIGTGAMRDLGFLTNETPTVLSGQMVLKVQALVLCEILAFLVAGWPSQ